MKIIAQSILYLALISILTGFIYPAFITCLGQFIWPYQSFGSLVKKDDKILGSMLVGQKFSAPEYFWPRPSASNYSAVPGMASNLGPTSRELKNIIKTRREFYGYNRKNIPEDLLLSSASGVDPHISLDALLFQKERVIKARNLDSKAQEKLEELILAHHERPWLGSQKQIYINVLMLNLSLEQSFANLVK